MLQQGFADLKLATHPEKKFVGRIERGFDFLGYLFSRGPLRLAARTVRHFGERVLRLYEQQRTAPEGAVRPGDCVPR